MCKKVCGLHENLKWDAFFNLILSLTTRQNLKQRPFQTSPLISGKYSPSYDIWIFCCFNLLFILWTITNFGLTKLPVCILFDKVFQMLKWVQFIIQFFFENFRKLWLNFTALAVLGFTFAFAVVPVYERLITYTKRAGYQDNMSTMSALGSLFWSAYSAGWVTIMIY